MNIAIDVMIACLLVFALVISGCSTKKTGNSADKQAGSQAATTDSKYPEKPITVIVNLAPGSPGDTTARLLTKYAEKYLPNNGKFVIVNKPGSAGAIGAAELYRAKPDGYTIGMSPAAAMCIQPALGNTPYKYDEFQPIVDFIDASQFWFVPWDSPWKTVDDVVKYMKENPGKLKFGMSGTMSAHHLALELFAQVADVKFDKVSYKSEPDETNAMLRGDVPIAILNGANALPYYESKKLRPIANITEVKQPYTDVPTLKEAGYDANVAFFNGMFAPKGISKEHLDVLLDTFTKALNDPELKKEFEKRKLVSNPKGPEEFQALITKLYENNVKVLKSMGYTKK